MKTGGAIGSVCLVLAALLVAAVGFRIAPAGGGDQRPLPRAATAQEMEKLRMNGTLDATLSPTGHSVPAPETALSYATFGAGCFWGVEAMFRRTPGVVATAVGYAGGKTENPTYKEVCSDASGHAEVVHLQYDPSAVKYEELLDLFWENHNPTTLNRQGPDVGSQYRSVIFYHDEAQRRAAEESKARQQKEGRWSGRTIVTFIEPAPAFYKAEDYHQRYLEKRGLTSCHGPAG